MPVASVSHRPVLAVRPSTPFVVGLTAVVASAGRGVRVQGAKVSRKPLASPCRRIQEDPQGSDLQMDVPWSRRTCLTMLLWQPCSAAEASCSTMFFVLPRHEEHHRRCLQRRQLPLSPGRDVEPGDGRITHAFGWLLSVPSGLNARGSGR